MNVPGRALAVIVLAVAVAVVLPGVALGDDDSTVVVSRPGVVYHRVGSGDLRGQGMQKSLADAQAAGYIPCPVCFAKETGSSVQIGSPHVAAGTAGSTAQVVHLGNGRSTVSVAQPFGLKAFVSGRAHPQQGYVRNPYEDPMTIKSRGREQGAYGTE
jgi:hypothetical protein